MDKKEEQNLEVTIKFIDEVKNSKFIKENIENIPISPRMDEPSVYSEDDEQPLLSFCN
jgi:hypothetical protein